MSSGNGLLTESTASLISNSAAAAAAAAEVRYTSSHMKIEIVLLNARLDPHFLIRESPLINETIL